MILFLCFSFLGLAKNSFFLTSPTKRLLYRLCRVVFQELTRNLMFSTVGLHKTAELLKCEASLPDPKSEVTPMSTPINRKAHSNHTRTVTPIMRTPETPSTSQLRFNDPGTPTQKVSVVFKENYSRDKVVVENCHPRLFSLPLSSAHLFYSEFSRCSFEIVQASHVNVESRYHWH